MTKQYDYAQAVDRNLGWLTSADQDKLKQARVAIAGVGGAGGYQTMALARLGVGKFKIADLDVFELTNFNRQTGATMLTLGAEKTTVIQTLIESINPEASIENYSDGISEQNIDSFLTDVDVVIDGVDFFAVDAKFLLYEKCRQKRIPMITACPVGFGASLLVFMPDGMDYKTYFDLKDNMDANEKARALAFGLTPSPLCLSYLNPAAINFGSGRASSLCPGLMLVGALASTEAVRILTGKSKVNCVPHVFQVDLFTQKVKKKRYPLGMKGPWMRIKRFLISKFILDRKASS